MYIEITKIHIDNSKIMFAKLIKNDDHVEFGKRLFAFLVKEFKVDINLDTKSKVYMLINIFRSIFKIIHQLLKY